MRCPIENITAEKCSDALAGGYCQQECLVERVINKTPHPINIVGGLELPACPKEELVRLAVSTVACPPVAGIPTSKSVFGEPVGLPEHEEGVYYVVSQMVKSALPDREDLLVPAEVQRDEKGQITGCKSLGR